MADIPVERKQGGFPWWLIPLLLLLLLLPLLYYCSKNTAVVDSTNNNTNRALAVSNSNANHAVVVDNTNASGSTSTTTTVMNANGSAMNSSGGSTAAFNEEERIREANERARLAMEKVYPNGTPQQVIDALNLSIVNFAKGSSVIPESSKPLLKQAAEQLKKSPADTRVEIDGHTDNDGDDATNQKLSERRAEAVRSELVRLGVPSAMLSTKGFGKTQPRATNDTPEGRFQNRRIEYKVATSSTTAEKVQPNGR